MVHLGALNVANGQVTVGSFAYSSGLSLAVSSVTPNVMPSGLTTRTAAHSYSRHLIRAFKPNTFLRCAFQSAVFCADLHVTLQGEEQ